MLGLAKRTGARFLQASTSEIYGDPTTSPQGENYWGNVNPIGIRSCYDEGKRAAETLTYDYHRQFEVDTRVARIFNTYGPRMAENDGRVISNFIVQALKGAPLTVFGDGNQTRSFCYVSDLIKGLIDLFFSEDIHEPVNLGNPNSITMLDLAHEIIERTGSHSQIEHVSLPEDDPRQREPDIRRAQELIGWSPVIERREGLDLTISYFKNRIY